MSTGSELETTSNRWPLIRDAVTFQVKLALDGLRDLILFPVSLVAALISVLAGGDKHSVFYDVVRLGLRTERWINLFGLVRCEPDDKDPGIDAFMDRLEVMVLEQYQRGGITASTKQSIDALLDRLEGGDKRRSASSDPDKRAE